MSTRTPLRADFADARCAFSGPMLPRIPYQKRSRLRMGLEALYRSEPVTRIRGRAGDASDLLLGRRDPELPPRRIRHSVGGGDFREVGQQFLRIFVEHGGLEPHHDVLDVGSGSGRMAHALRGWLTGRYEGFDVVPEAVEWCRREIGARCPNFNFQLADVRSERYNPAGAGDAADYDFPYADESFDFAFITSVFTHLQRPAVENYLGEVARVLRPSGRCLATYFLMNDEAERLMGGHGQFGFDQGEQLVVDDRVPERMVAFREDDVRRLHDRCGLPVEAFRYGSWCGRDDYVSFQDITVSVLR